MSELRLGQADELTLALFARRILRGSSATRVPGRWLSFG